MARLSTIAGGGINDFYFGAEEAVIGEG